MSLFIFVVFFVYFFAFFEKTNEFVKLKEESIKTFYNSLVGKTYNMLVEEKEDNHYVGFTENYVKVYVSEPLTENQIVKVKLIKPFKAGMLAESVKGD